MSEEEFREFIRQQTLRHERATQAMERWLRTVDRRVDEMAARTEEMITEMRSLREEHREESQAQRKALFAILDRLGGGAEPATG